MYGVHPRLTVLDRNGDAYGLLFLNSAAQVNSETGSAKTSYVKFEFYYLSLKAISKVKYFLGAGGHPPSRYNLQNYW